MIILKISILFFMAYGHNFTFLKEQFIRESTDYLEYLTLATTYITKLLTISEALPLLHLTTNKIFNIMSFNF